MREQLANALLSGDDIATRDLTATLLEQGESPVGILEDILLPTIRKAGDLWEEGELFIPELLQASAALKAGLEVIKPLLPASSESMRGTIIVGTIQGDIHDIGKTLVAGMLESAGHRVVDLGADVSPQSFVGAAQREAAQLICISALLTTTMLNQESVVTERNNAALQGRVGILVGGAPVTREWADRIGAEGYAPDAFRAVQEAARLLAIVQ